MKEEILSAQSPLGDNLVFYKNIWKGDDDETLSIVAGLQGDRLNGIWTATRLSRFLQDVEDGKEKDYQLSGTVQIFPAVNLPAVESATQSWSFDNLDMDLAFPGSEIGDLNEKIREALARHTKNSSYGIILQTATAHYEDFPHLQLLGFSRRQRRLANLFNLGITRAVPRNSSLNLQLVKQWGENGVSPFIVSAGSPQSINYEFCDSTFKAVLNFMARTGILKHLGEKDKKDETVFYEPENEIVISSSQAGIFKPEVCVGTHLDKGRKLGEMIEIYSGKTVEEVIAPEGGRLVSLLAYPVVYQRQPLAVLLTERKSRWRWPFA